MDLIIPVYNSNTIDATLASIAYQTDTDINVYIIDDFSDIDYSDIIDFYRNYLKITYYKMDRNLGPGRARQTGIDISNSDYIMFMDADDCFASPNVIETLKCYTNDNYDLIISTFVEECGDDIIEHKADETWLHGKVYSRRFIENNRIHFNETRKNEDNFFNQLILLHEPNVFFTEVISYIYRSNANSITRSNNYEYAYSGNASFAYNISEAMREAKLDNCNPVKIASIGFRSLMTMYYLIIKWKDKDISEMVKNAKKIYRLTDFNVLSNEDMEAYIDYYFNLIKEDDIDVYNSMDLSLDEYWKMMGDNND